MRRHRLRRQHALDLIGRLECLLTRDRDEDLPTGTEALGPVGEDMVHHDTYDMSKYMTNEQVLKYLYSLREKTVPIYRNSYVGQAQETKK